MRIRYLFVPLQYQNGTERFKTKNFAIMKTLLSTIEKINNYGDSVILISTEIENFDLINGYFMSKKAIKDSEDDLFDYQNDNDKEMIEEMNNIINKETSKINYCLNVLFSDEIDFLKKHSFYGYKLNGDLMVQPC